MKNIKLTESKADPLINDQGDPPQFLYPTDSWIPFAIVVNPDASRYKDHKAPQVQYSECLWYSDA